MIRILVVFFFVFFFLLFFLFTQNQVLHSQKLVGRVLDDSYDQFIIKLMFS